MSHRFRVYLVSGILAFILIVLTIRVSPLRLPGLLGFADTDVRQFLTMKLFTVGKVSVSILFLFKSAVFMLLLSMLTAKVRKLLYSRLRQTAMGDARAYMLARFASMSVFGIGLLAGLEISGLNLNTLAIIGGTLGVGVGFGLQSVVSNWVAGLVLLIEQPIRIGDVIALQSLTGVIVRIGGRSTWLRTYDDEIVIIPNSDLTNHKVVNWTANDLKVRLTIPVGVGYQSDPDEVRDLLMKIMSDSSGVLKSPAAEVIFDALGDSSLNFRLRFWAEVLPDRDHYALKSDLYFAILKCFREQGIEIPFPQRDVHLLTTERPSKLVKSTAAGR